MGILFTPIAPISMPNHHRHILQMALAALGTHGAVVRVVEHQRFDHRLAKFNRVIGVQ